MRRLLFWSFLLCLSFPSEIALGNPNQLGYGISTDKERYILGESIAVTFSWQNATSRNFSIESWLMEPIEVSYGDQETRIPFKGIISCGTPGYELLRSRQKIEKSYVINNFFGPNYAVSKPGRYVLRSTYASSYYRKRNNFWIGTISAPAISFEVRTLTEKELAEYRPRISSGDFQAIQIVAAHRDEASIPSLVTLTKSAETTTRQMAYQALANIGSDESIRSLAEAAVEETLPMEKVKILFSLKELHNPVVIPYLKRMLTDTYVGALVTTRRDGKVIRYKDYTVRRWAYVVLKDLGVEVPTVYEEEIKQF
jgi:hypothetical protein